MCRCDVPVTAAADLDVFGFHSVFVSAPVRSYFRISFVASQSHNSISIQPTFPKGILRSRGSVLQLAQMLGVVIAVCRFPVESPPDSKDRHS